MAWGATTGVRALQWLKETLGIIHSKPEKMFVAERMGDLSGKAFAEHVSSLEKEAAKHQNSRWRNEHTDAYCFLRDYRYGRRSRRWLMTKAMDTKLENTSDLWTNFVRINHVFDPTVDRLLKEDVNSLSGQKPEQLMKP